MEKNIINNEKTDLIVHIGKDDSEIMISDKARLVFSRGFKNSESFLEEVGRSVLSYKRDKNSPSIDRALILYPSNIDMEEARPYIQRHLDVPASFHEYKDDLRDIGFSAQIDLLPKEVKEGKVKSEKKKELLFTCSLIAFFLLLVIFFFWFKLHQKDKISEALSKKLGQIQPGVSKLEDAQRRAGAIKDHAEKGRFIVKILWNLSDLKDYNILLSGLSYDGKETIIYKGRSEDMQAVFSFARRLEGTGFFDKVEMKQVTKKKMEGKEFSDFSLHCRITGRHP